MVIPAVLQGLGGWPARGFFGAASWVDLDKPAGHTPFGEGIAWQKVLRTCVTLEYFFYAPNLVWFAITLAVYACFPYDFEAARKGWAVDWVAKRVAVCFAVALPYYSFFFWALYIHGASQRKFQPETYPTFGNMLHNLWYWSLGILQWALSECAMTRLWATGKVPYLSDKEVMASPSLLLATFVLALLVPLGRDIHFYIAHRFVHIRAVYKYVHAVHHRNTDPEPFSGLCMHPVEHLYYYTGAWIPPLCITCSPFVFAFVFMHAALAPGAGHSGFEDHWQADAYHYLHHAKFECNYGSPLMAWLDILCGTFREKLGASGAYKGVYRDDYAVKSKEGKVWSPQSYLGVQAADHLLYTAFCVAATLLVVLGAARASSAGDALPGPAVAALAAYGPLVVPLLLCSRTDSMPWRWPFHKERVVGAFGIFAAAGWLLCVFPVYRLIVLLCAP